jgi:hypothetical protein
MNTKKNNSVKTVLTISVGFGIVFLLTDLSWSLYTSVIVGVIGLISNKLAQTIDFLWMKLAKVLSLIIPNILLTAIFYLFLYPISILSKIFVSKDTLQLKNKKDSVWVDKTHQIEKVSFEKMW